MASPSRLEPGALAGLTAPWALKVVRLWTGARCLRGTLAVGRLDAAVRQADILLTSMTPRASRSLGVDAWRASRVPALLHVELVAFDEPWSDAPGLGEHAAAEAGLLWRPSRSPSLNAADRAGPCRARCAAAPR